MARRKRKEEEPDWVPPEFDEVAFMRKEMENAKIAVGVVAWAVVGAIVGTLLYAYVHPAAGFFVGLATFGALYFLFPMLGLPIHGNKPRDWINRFGTYFFCWLAFFILLLNPPFGDHTYPNVQFERAATYTPVVPADPAAHSIYCVTATGSTARVGTSSNTTLYVLFRATDNVGVRTLTARASSSAWPTQNLTPVDMNGAKTVCSNEDANLTYGPGSYAVKMPSPGVPVTVTVTARDEVGLETTATSVVMYA